MKKTALCAAAMVLLVAFYAGSATAATAFQRFSTGEPVFTDRFIPTEILHWGPLKLVFSCTNESKTRLSLGFDSTAEGWFIAGPPGSEDPVFPLPANEPRTLFDAFAEPGKTIFVRSPIDGATAISPSGFILALPGAILVLSITPEGCSAAGVVERQRSRAFANGLAGQSALATTAREPDSNDR